MKNVISLFVLLMISISGYANFRSITVKDSLLQKKSTWDKTKLWVVKDMDKYNARIAYQDYDNGIMIIKGEYKADDDGLQSEREGLLTFHINYEIEINCCDGLYSAKYNNISCRVVSGYANFSYISTFSLNMIKQELEVVRDIMIKKGEVFEIDDYFDSEYEKQHSSVKDAEIKKDDKNLKRSERKKYNKYYENNRWKPYVYSYINHLAYELSYRTLYGGFSREFNGLGDFIKHK